MYPVWTADGSAIIYSSVREGIVMKPLVGTGEPRRLFAAPQHNAMLIPAHLTGDGAHVVFFGDLGTSTGFDIYTVPTAGGTPTAIVKGPSTQAEPQVSPDGRWLAYAGVQSTSFEVFVQPLPPTGAIRQVSRGGGRQPAWRHDGRELYYLTDDQKFYAVDVRPGTTFEFGTPRFLFDMPTNPISVRNSYVPSRDGQRFLVNRRLDATVPPINVVVNWTGVRER